MFRANSLGSSIELRLHARQSGGTPNVPDRSPGREDEPSRKTVPQTDSSSGSIHKKPDYQPLQREALVDAIEQSLAATDWDDQTRKAFLGFTQYAVQHSPLAKLADTAVIVTLDDFFRDMAVRLEDPTERDAIRYIRQTFRAMETIVPTQPRTGEVVDVENRREIMRVRNFMELAQNASHAVSTKEKKEVLDLICEYLRRELEIIEKSLSPRKE